MLLTEKVGSVEYRVTDSSDGRTWLVDPAAYLSALQAERMTTQPDLILATAQIIRDDYARRGRGRGRMWKCARTHSSRLMGDRTRA